MSETTFDARSPGEMLRAARERQGMHIASLAAAIKVSPRKLDALEHDRWDELPDATFIRALAQTVCRTLKIDAGPVLALLPRTGAVALEPGSGGLNAPFRDRPGRDEPGMSATAVRPMVVAATVLMVAAIAVYFVPERYWRLADLRGTPAAPSPAASASSAAPSGPMFPPAAPSDGASAAEAGMPVLAQAPQLPPLAATTEAIAAPVRAETAIAAAPVAVPAISATSATSASAATPGLIQLRVRSSSWIEARDAAGRTLLSRVVQTGESLGLDGALPVRLTIGNAAATQLDFRGQNVDLAPSTRDNVARVELK